VHSAVCAVNVWCRLANADIIILKTALQTCYLVWFIRVISIVLADVLLGVVYTCSNYRLSKLSLQTIVSACVFIF
jgi:hypothetical protein